jgi:hypothetical protein
VLAFASLAVIVVAAGALRRRSAAPLALAAAGLAVLGYVMLVDYNAAIELGGFALLGAAVLWDYRSRHAQPK